MSKIAEVINNIREKNLEAASSTLKSAISEVAAERLEKKKIEIAKSYFGKK